MVLNKAKQVKIFREDIDSKDLTCYIRGVGIKENMFFGIVDRPQGTKDWFFSYFHDRVTIKSSEGFSEHPAGSFIIWSDSDSHYYGSKERDWSHSWIHFAGKGIMPIILESGLETNKVMHLNSSDIITNTLSLIYNELTDYAEPDLSILQNLFHNFILRLSREAKSRDIVQIPHRILNIKNLLETYPSSRFTIADLAKKASMSAPHFCSEFKKCIGVSPIEYHIRIRLQQARYLLYDFNLSIAEIAERIGYCDIYQFSKQFKKHFGLSPSLLRSTSSPRGSRKDMKAHLR